MKLNYYYKYYNNHIIKYNFINAFKYRTTSEVPKIEKLTVDFNQDQLVGFFRFFSFSNILTLKPGSLEVKPKITYGTGTSKVKEKSRDKEKLFYVTYLLKKKLMWLFISKLSQKVIQPKHLKIGKNFGRLKPPNIALYPIRKMVAFNLMRDNYLLFKKLETGNKLRLSLVTTSKKKEELVFLLYSYKLMQPK